MAGRQRWSSRGRRERFLTVAGADEFADRLDFGEQGIGAF